MTSLDMSIVDDIYDQYQQLLSRCGDAVPNDKSPLHLACVKHLFDDVYELNDEELEYTDSYLTTALLPSRLDPSHRTQMLSLLDGVEAIPEVLWYFWTRYGFLAMETPFVDFISTLQEDPLINISRDADDLDVAGIIPFARCDEAGALCIDTTTNDGSVVFVAWEKNRKTKVASSFSSVLRMVSLSMKNHYSVQEKKKFKASKTGSSIVKIISSHDPLIVKTWDSFWRKLAPFKIT